MSIEPGQSCPSLEDLEQYFGRTLDDDSSVRIRNHLSICDSCRGNFEEVAQNQDVMGRISRLFPKAHSGGVPEAGEFDGFTILGEIGRGGMGVVYEAEQHQPKRTVAIKVVRASDSFDDHRLLLFEREVQALGLLKHPNIADIYAADRTRDGRHYFVMERVVGLPLKAHLAQEQPTREQRLTLFQRVCDAIHYAHLRGVLHRDLKPSNILVERQSDGIPKILDFGLAKINNPDSAVATVETEVGRIQGTVPYMSPEQVRGDPNAIDLRTDVYSLGVILYELMTSRLPYALSRSIPDAARTICESAPVRPGSLDRRLGGDLETIMLKALEKQPERRYESAAALRDDIKRYVDGQPITARPPSAAYQLRKLVVRHRFSAALIVMLLLGIVGFAANAWIDSTRITEERDRARLQADRAKQINQFLQEMLASADPQRDRGRSLTVRDVLAESSTHLSQTLSGDPEIEAAVRMTIGRTYEALGEYEDAESELRIACELFASSSGSKHVDTLECRSHLGHILMQREKLAEAEQVVFDVLRAARQSLGEEHGFTVEALGAAGCLRLGQERFKEAETLLSDSLERAKAVHGDDAEETLALMSTLANAFQKAGRFAQAESLFRELLELRSKRLGDDHPKTLNSMNNLGLLLHRTGHLADAERLLRNAASERTRVLGSEHPDTLVSHHNLALLLSTRGNYVEAERLNREILATRTRILGEGHSRTLSTQHNLGRVLQKQGKFQAAEQTYRKTMETAERTLGVDHTTTIVARNSLASTLGHMGQVELAADLLEIALGTCRRKYGDHHPRTANTLVRLAALKARQGTVADAIDCYQEAEVIQRKTLGPDSMHLAVTLNNLARTLERDKRFQEAEALAADALRIRQSQLEGDHPDVATSLSLYADVLVGVGDAAKAEPLHRKAVAMRQRVHDEGHWLTLMAQSGHANCLMVLGQYDEAVDLLEPTVSGLAARLGENHMLTREARSRLAAALQKRDPTWAEPLEQPGLPNLHRVTDQLYRGGQPEEIGFASLKTMGIKSVLNLRTLHSDRAQCRKHGLRYFKVTVQAWEAEEDEVREFLEIVSDPDNQPVFVHCQHGADRTGMMCAIYRMVVQGWSREAAVREMTEGGFGFHAVWENLVKYVESVDTQRFQPSEAPTRGGT